MKYLGFLCVMILIGCQSVETAQTSANAYDDIETSPQSENNTEDDSEGGDKGQNTESDSTDASFDVTDDSTNEGNSGEDADTVQVEQEEADSTQPDPVDDVSNAADVNLEVLDAHTDTTSLQDSAEDTFVPDTFSDAITPEDDTNEPSDVIETDSSAPDTTMEDAGEEIADALTELLFEPTCENYCKAMENTCMHEAFHPAENCMLWCQSDLAPIPAGTPQDIDVDTLGCRMNWINQAKNSDDMAEKMMFCANANASGGNTCGSFCDVYCRQAVPVCTPINPDINPMKTINFGGGSPGADIEACMNVCAGFSTDVMEGVSQTEQHFGYGDTIQCRLHHLQAAMLQGPVENNAFGLHCGHAAPEPTELCLDDAEPNGINYCEFALAFCPQLFQPGTNTEKCRSTIKKLIDDGVYEEGGFESFTDTDTNSVGCLNYWIMTAPHDPEGCQKGNYDPKDWVINGGEGVCESTLLNAP